MNPIADLERSLICAMIGKATAEEWMGLNVSPSFFSLPIHRAVWVGALALAEQGQSPTLQMAIISARQQRVILSTQDYDQLAPLSQSAWAATTGPREAEGIAKSLKMASSASVQLNVLDEARSAIMEGRGVDLEALNSAFIVDEKERGSVNPIKRYLLDMKAVWSGERASVVIPTCLTSLNANIGGGWRRGKLQIIAARPGHGKSSLAEQDFMFQTKKGLRAIYLPVEMGSEAHIENIVKRECYEMLRQENALNYENAAFLSFHQKQTAELAILEILKHNPVILEPDRPTNQCSEWIALCRNQNPDVVYVDYVQDLYHDDKTAGTNQDIKKVVSAWLSFAKTRRCAVVLLAQFNRAIEMQDKSKPQRKAQMSDLSDSADLEKKAAIILTPNWSDELEEAEIHISKCRYAPKGKSVPFALDRKRRLLIDDL